MNAALLSSVKMDWQTPDNVLDLVRQVGPIALDPCTTDDNPTKALAYYTPATDGLSQSWTDSNGIVYVNPPYGRALPLWLDKCWHEADAGAEVLALVPARTDTTWWQSNVLGASICFWRGRLRFKGAPHPAPFPSALLYWGYRDSQFRKVFEGFGWTVRA